MYPFIDVSYQSVQIRKVFAGIFKLKIVAHNDQQVTSVSVIFGLK